MATALVGIILPPSYAVRFNPGQKFQHRDRVEDQRPCVYGALTFPNPANEPQRGVDRKDSAMGYLPGNCVPCCDRHNRAKNDTFTYDEWLTICADYNVQCGAARQGRKKMPRTYAPALPRRQAGLAGWLNRQPSQPASHIS